GFSLVEIYGMPPHFDVEDAAAAESLASALKASGVKAASLHAPYLFKTAGGKKRTLSITSGDDEVFEAALRLCRAAAAAAAVVGAPLVVLHCGKYGDPMSGEIVSNLASFMATVSPHLPSGVNLALENVASPVSEPSFLSNLLSTAPPRVGICLDIAHANISGDPAKAVEAAGQRLIHIHASDNNGVRDDHLIPTDGDIEWKTVFSALKKSGYEGTFCFEPRKAVDPESAMKRCLGVFKMLNDDTI
ncbi:MAG TPA: sugar phosphate isomerase/epimerase, partial [bacterium]|nr:sugar phosphate isomerase/epimerase [bacterium]